MAKFNISFNGNSYSIDESALSSASTELQSHLSTIMNGTGATIKIDGTTYNVDATKLANARNTFVAHLGTVSGSGSKVVVNGTEYSVDSTKLNGAVADLQTVLSDLQSEGGSTWEAVTWNGLSSFNGKYVWSDGENIYYSYAADHYVLNKETSTWEPKTWEGVTHPVGSECGKFNGDGVWVYGEDIYCFTSQGNYPHVLRKGTNTWEPVTWNAEITPSPSNMWTDGENIYCAIVSGVVTGNFKFNGSDWEQTTLELVPINHLGSDIWTDGENIYYSNFFTHYILNKETGTWESMTWEGIPYFSGSAIWIDGEDVYYGFGYVLKKGTNIWENSTWKNVPTTPLGLWTDGENVYNSNGSDHYILKR